MSDVILSGGPRHGQVFDVDMSQQIVYAVAPESIDITTFGSVEPEYIMGRFRQAEYRARRWLRCGSPAYDADGHAIYDYIGTD